jgi:hypothetical protein
MLNNFQGQALTPTERAINRSAPGFAMMLQSVQQFANRVEENRRLAEQRNFQKERDQSQFDNQIKLLEVSTAAQLANQKELAGIQHGYSIAEATERAKLQREATEFQFGLQTSDELLEFERNKLRLTAQAQSASLRDKQRFDLFQTQEKTLQGYLEKYPSFFANVSVAVDEQGNPVYARRGVVDGEVRYQQMGAADFNGLIAQASIANDRADGLEALLQQGQYPPEIRNQIIQTAEKIRNGLWSEDVSKVYDELRALSTLDTSEEIVRRRETHSIVADVLTNVRWESVDGKFGNKFVPTQDALRMDNTLMGIIQRGGGSIANVENAIRGHLRNNYASLQDMDATARSQGWHEQGDSKIAENQRRFNLTNNINALINQPRTTGSVDDVIMIDPFASLTTGNSIISLDEMVTRVFETFKNAPMSAEAVAAEEIRSLTGI